MRVTFDTNVFPADELIRRLSTECDVAVVSVTARELEGTSFEVGIKPIREIIPETGVLDESRLDEFVWAADEEDPLEAVLKVISSGSFPRPGNRDSLTDRQRTQLRDAMIFSAHLRDHREVFVTRDSRGFINHGRREALEAAFGTKIMTPDEFEAAI